MAVTATFKQIRAGLVANLAPLGIQSTGYLLSAPTAPAVEVSPSGVSYDQSFGRGMDLLEFTVRVSVSASLDVPAQQTLDEYLAPSGAKSVKTLLESDKTLGGVVHDIHVTEATGHQIATVEGGGVVLSASWTVMVRA